jgi:nucleoside phosphorylase
MFFSGCERLANAEPCYAELAAKLDKLLADGGKGLLDPGDVAVILGEGRADVIALLRRATHSEIDLLVEVEVMICGNCGRPNEFERVEKETEEFGESDCTYCSHPIDPRRARTAPRYGLSSSAEEELSRLERRPQRKALLLTALPEEQNAVVAHLNDRSEAVVGAIVYDTGRFESSQNVWTVWAAQIGTGNVAAAAGTMKALLQLDPAPDMALFIGIAGGLKDDVGKGDVVAARKVHGYEPAKAGKELILRPDQMRASESLVQRAQAVARSGEWVKRIANTPEGTAPRGLVEEIASGEKVVSSLESELYKQLRANFDRCVAVEEEGIGFLIANHLNPGADPLVIRGISDMVENKTETDKAGWQLQAAANASAFAFELLATL